MNFTFRPQSITLCPPDAAAAKRFLEKLGAGNWEVDRAMVSGRVRGLGGSGEIETSEESDLMEEGVALEIVEFIDGNHHMQGLPASVACLGMVCRADALPLWKKLFADEGVAVAQEGLTFHHSFAGKQFSHRVHFIIFATRSILGVDLRVSARVSLKEPKDAG